MLLSRCLGCVLPRYSYCSSGISARKRTAVQTRQQTTEQQKTETSKRKGTHPAGRGGQEGGKPEHTKREVQAALADFSGNLDHLKEIASEQQLPVSLMRIFHKKALSQINVGSNLVAAILAALMIATAPEEFGSQSTTPGSCGVGGRAQIRVSHPSHYAQEPECPVSWINSDPRTINGERSLRRLTASGFFPCSNAPYFRSPCSMRRIHSDLKHAASSRMLALTHRTSQQRAVSSMLLRAQFTFAPPVGSSRQAARST